MRLQWSQIGRTFTVTLSWLATKLNVWILDFFFFSGLSTALNQHESKDLFHDRWKPAWLSSFSRRLPMSGVYIWAACWALITTIISSQIWNDVLFNSSPFFAGSFISVYSLTVTHVADNKIICRHNSLNSEIVFMCYCSVIPFGHLLLLIFPSVPLLATSCVVVKVNNFTKP